jgi:hypothetical protein
MADILLSQVVFSKGELAPSMYARVDYQNYYKALKTAKNILPVPQGGARKRFGTILSTALTQTDYQTMYPMAFEYINECIYQVIFYDTAIDIYLEGTLQATVAATGIASEDINLIDETVLENKVRVTVGYQTPKDLTRAASAANTINAYDTVTNLITLNTAITNGIILPVRFTGALGTTVPQIKIGRTYFIKAFSTTTAGIYLSATDARDNLNIVDITVAGGVSTMVAQNTWAFNAVTFKNKPVYDFTGGYDAITFTPAATTGATTLAASAPIFTAAMVGGIFAGNGGIARITAFTSNILVSILVTDDFSSGAAILGSLAVLTEPAWSDARGWPRSCGSYQNRAIFANSESLPNGLWLSVINDYEDYDDSTLDDDQAISWYPTADVGMAINFITPYRSLIINTDAGVYSTPLQNEAALTPRNFSLSLQDSTPSNNIQPITIDNQVIVVAGRDVVSLQWEFGSSAFKSDVISVPSEHLITDPISMAGFRDRSTAGSRYVFIINRDGTMAMFQTLLSQEIAGWTWAQTSQSNGNSYFRKVISSIAGRCWFIVERQKATAQAPIAITGFSAPNDTLTAVASNISTTEPLAVLFSTANTLPATVPQINTTTYYFALGVTADEFKIYLSKEAALANSGAIEITSAGVGANVIKYTLSTILTLEELSYDVNTDCAVVQTGTALAQATGLNLFNAQTMTVKGDGRRYDSNAVIGGVENITILSQPATVDEVQVGYAIEGVIEPLPISAQLSADPRSSNIAQAKHIRFVNLMCVDTVGGRINNQNIALSNLNFMDFQAPVGQLGLMQVSLMAGWNQFKAPPFTITHDEPYDFNLIGLFYRVEV